jgi:hypothetical protein
VRAGTLYTVQWHYQGMTSDQQVGDCVAETIVCETPKRDYLRQE